MKLFESLRFAPVFQIICAFRGLKLSPWRGIFKPLKCIPHRDFFDFSDDARRVTLPTRLAVIAKPELGVVDRKLA